LSYHPKLIVVCAEADVPSLLPNRGAFAFRVRSDAS
jgi:hypothetical protein